MTHIVFLVVLRLPRNSTLTDTHFLYTMLFPSSGIYIDSRPPRFLAAINQIGRARDAHHQQDGDAALGEAEMVDAVEDAAFGQALGRYRAALRPREAREIVLERALPLADEEDR